MEKYILLSEEEIEDLTKGQRISYLLNGDMTFIMSEEAFKKQMSITEDQWQKAIEYLDEMIVMYATIGWAGQFGLQGVLVPLIKRYESGERTKELYDAIMACE